MNDSEIIHSFLEIRQYSGKNGRAPHKPLLMVVALTNILHEGNRWLSFKKSSPILTELLEIYGKPAKKQHPEYPFWRLQNDKIWECSNKEKIVVNKSGDVNPKQLVSEGVQGAFNQDIYNALIKKPQFILQLINLILENNFEESICSEIRTMLHLDSFSHDAPSSAKKRKRDANFPLDVKKAYGYRCAICDLDCKLGRTEFAIEASHIQWHAFNGPDTVNNGVALCSIHHKAFDRGSITIDFEYKMELSPLFNGTSELSKLMFDKLSGKELRQPRDRKLNPGFSFIEWHRREVFKSKI